MCHSLPVIYLEIFCYQYFQNKKYALNNTADIIKIPRKLLFSNHINSNEFNVTYQIIQESQILFDGEC